MQKLVHAHGIALDPGKLVSEETVHYETIISLLGKKAIKEVGKVIKETERNYKRIIKFWNHELLLEGVDFSLEINFEKIFEKFKKKGCKNNLFVI